MLTKRFWRRRAAVVCAMVFILSLFALNIQALVTGKVEVNKAEAWRLWIFGVHKKYSEDTDGDGVEDTVVCKGNGFNCFSIYTPW